MARSSTKNSSAKPCRRCVADPRLTTLLEQLKEETTRYPPSGLLIRGRAQALAVHVAREYTVPTESSRGEASSLPGFKLRGIIDWMSAHLADEFSLSRLADQAGMSEFHFNRVFKRATGIPPSQYQISSGWTRRAVSSASPPGA